MSGDSYLKIVCANCDFNVLFCKHKTFQIATVIYSVCSKPKWTIYGGSEEGHGWSGRIRCVSLEKAHYSKLLKKKELFLNLNDCKFRHEQSFEDFFVLDCIKKECVNSHQFPIGSYQVNFIKVLLPKQRLSDSAVSIPSEDNSLYLITSESVSSDGKMKKNESTLKIAYGKKCDNLALNSIRFCKNKLYSSIFED